MRARCVDRTPGGPCHLGAALFVPCRTGAFHRAASLSRALNAARQQHDTEYIITFQAMPSANSICHVQLRKRAAPFLGPPGWQALQESAARI